MSEGSANDDRQRVHPPEAGRREIVVPADAAGSRLDKFASREMGVSRSEVARWIDGGRVTVASRVPRASTILRGGEKLIVDPEPPRRSKAVPDSTVAFAVLHKDHDLLVIDKPPGLVVHPARGNETGTLVNGLLATGLFAEEMGTEVEHVRPGIVHRLDKGTSGLMVVARNAPTREALKAQFAARSIDRAYVAIAVGRAETRTHATLHGRHPTNRLRFTSRLDKGKPAVTHVDTIERLNGATLVRCTLETGRTHQIRVHLSESGTPVLGDPVYGRPPRDERVHAVGAKLGHQALHAFLLGFTHPGTGKRVTFESSPPPDFQRALEALRQG